MQIRILFFGVLKDLVGRTTDVVDFPDGTRLQDVLAHYVRQTPRLEPMLAALAFSVNQEYAGPERKLYAGDEVGLLPPVSGGAPTPRGAEGKDNVGDESKKKKKVENKQSGNEVRIVREPIATAAVLAALKRPEDGAAVVFEGIVRDNTRGRRTLYLDYEAYEAMAQKQLESLAAEARERFVVRAVSIVHRLGRLEIGETSVLIVVASAHRGAAFEACRWMIDTLKKTVPIWKKEYFEDGAVWADGEAFPEEIQRAAGTMSHKPASK
jgi:molybdopterin synthase catalytic subunit/molybdopterin converting factor small subunit